MGGACYIMSKSLSYKLLCPNLGAGEDVLISPVQVLREEKESFSSLKKSPALQQRTRLILYTPIASILINHYTVYNNNMYSTGG